MIDENEKIEIRRVLREEQRKKDEACKERVKEAVEQLKDSIKIANCIRKPELASQLKNICLILERTYGLETNND